MRKNLKRLTTMKKKADSNKDQTVAFPPASLDAFRVDASTKTQYLQTSTHSTHARLLLHVFPQDACINHATVCTLPHNTQTGSTTALLPTPTLRGTFVCDDSHSYCTHHTINSVPYHSSLASKFFFVFIKLSLSKGLIGTALVFTHQFPPFPFFPIFDNGQKRKRKKEKEKEGRKKERKRERKKRKKEKRERKKKIYGSYQL